MPYRKYRKRFYRRKMPYRRYRKRYKRNRKNKMRYTISRTVGQPDAMYVKLVYSQVTQKTPAGPTTNHVFRGNSAFDPDFTGIGGQPNSFDQYATLYRDYQVLGSAIKVKMVNNSANALGFVIYPSLSTTAVGYDDGIGNSYSKYKICGQNTAYSIATVSNFIRTKKLIGRNTNSVNYAALISANPASQWYWIIDMRSMDGASVIDATLQAELTYYVKFWNRKTVVDV